VGWGVRPPTPPRWWEYGAGAASLFDMKQLLWSRILVLLLVASLASCASAPVSPGQSDSPAADSAQLLVDQRGNFGDSKLVSMNDRITIVATLDGTLQYRSIDTPFRNTQPVIQANWQSVVFSDTKTLIGITGSFQDHNIRIYEINIDSGKSALMSSIVDGDELKIDPTIIKAPDGFYATYTQVRGTVNNDDINKPNGEYAIILYRSVDLRTWAYVSTIVSAKNNLEDGRLLFDPDASILYFEFEREIVDKGHSAIHVAVSEDMGASWPEDKVLLDTNADQEPAYFAKIDDTFYLYYSSDIDHNGTGSYEYASIKQATFDSDLHMLQKDVDLALPRSALLLDVLRQNQKNYYLFIRHYLTQERALVLATV
jgi:hypothetical protein